MTQEVMPKFTATSYAFQTYVPAKNWIAGKMVDAQSGESLSSTIIGSGQDKGDKGPYKAYTGAQKYFLMKTFMIPTGDDPEKDDEQSSTSSSSKTTSTRKPTSSSKSNGHHCEDCNRELTGIPARNGKPAMPVEDYVDWVKRVTGGRVLCSTCRKRAA